MANRPSSTAITAAPRVQRGRNASTHPQGPATTPQGPWPVVTLPIKVSVSVSTTDTSPEGPLAVRRRLPSALSASPQGRAPTATSPISLPSCGEITATVPPPACRVERHTHGARLLAQLHQLRGRR